MNKSPVRRVVKLGGSLLSIPELHQRVWQWIGQQPEMPTLWLVGGGALVETLRQWQTIQVGRPFADEDAHWACIDLMSVTARMFGSLFPQWPIVSSPGTVQGHIDSGQSNLVFDCSEWIKGVSNLPCDWSVTSDSIAGRLAIELCCDELVLLKSCDRAGESIDENVSAGVIDDHFRLLNWQSQISIAIVNLMR